MYNSLKYNFLIFSLNILIILSAPIKLGNSAIKKNHNVAKSLTQEQLILSRIINAEADSNDTLDMYLIGSTVLNRAYRSSDFPNNIDSVIHQRNQYHGINSKKYYKNNPLTDTIAVRLLRGQYIDTTVLYFYNFRTSTNIKFISKLKSRELKYQTKYHKFF